jgi:hypothetical protein
VVCTFASTGAAVAACGNGVLEVGEDCDDGSQNNTLNSCCTSNCKFSGEYPDVIVGMLYGSTQTGGNLTRWGTSGGVTAYSVGTKSCNIGTCWLNWISNTNQHPVIGQNLYRLKAGRFEHIGQSWLKHGFTALTENLCGSCNSPPNGSHLGVNCSDPYSAGLNGQQDRLGPKWEVNPDNGVYPYPFTNGSGSGNLYKRLQVRNSDLDPAQNPGALYYVEGQYVTNDDALAKMQNNNASYRRATIGASPYDITLQDTTVQQQPAIRAWKVNDPLVTETNINAQGLMILAARATLVSGNVYHYEYALFNMNSQRSGQSFTVPIPPGTTVTNVGFHDVDYHSGEPFGPTDWTPTVGAASVGWATQTFTENANANALRWGTLYNFRFDADVPPGTGSITLGLFQPGTPAAVNVSTVVPGQCSGAADGLPCNDNNACTQTDTCLAGACNGTNPVVCVASDGCHLAGTCSTVTGVCSNPARPDGAPCNDGNACTQTDGCQSGSCIGANPVVCSASDECHDAGTCDPGNGACSNPAKPDGSPCSDGSLCTQSDDCQAGSCVGANPVVCSASDQCHVVGECDPGTGSCSNPVAENGTGCDDANACTENDACADGACVGQGAPVPPEVGNDVSLAQEDGVTTISWNPTFGATGYDVIRGAVGGLPVGPGDDDEICLANNSLSTSITDADDPLVDEGFWYLVLGQNLCGTGPGGYERQNGVPTNPRSSTTCP